MKAAATKTVKRRLTMMQLQQLVCVVLVSTVAICSATPACSGRIKTVYETIIDDGIPIPGQMIAGQGLGVCTSAMTCCTADMESQLIRRSKADFDLQLASKLSRAKQTFISRTAKFDALFVEILNTSRYQLQNTFRRTNDDVYTRSNRMFTDLYDNLKSFYKGTDLSLADTIDRFFSKLAFSLFERHTLASGNIFRPSPGYFDCFNDQIDRIQPFDDLPLRLLRLIRRSFIAARSLIDGLNVGRDTIFSASKVQPSEVCLSAMTGMLYCPLCRGLVPPSNDRSWQASQIKPCSWYCRDVMTRCLSKHAELNTAWNEFLDALQKVASTSEGSFSVDRAIASISDHISLAMVKFNEQSNTVDSVVLDACGPPSAYNNRRVNRDSSQRISSPGGASQHSTTSRRRLISTAVSVATDRGIALQILVRELTGRLETSRNLWLRLPETICNDLEMTLTRSYMPVDSVNRCWNGRTLVPVTSQQQPTIVTIPDVLSSTEVQKANKIREIIVQLQLSTNKLKNAYNGVDGHATDPVDGQEDSVSGSGSGQDILKWTLPNVSGQDSVNDVTSPVTVSSAGGRFVQCVHSAVFVMATCLILI